MRSTWARDGTSSLPPERIYKKPCGSHEWHGQDGYILTYENERLTVCG